MDWMTLARSFGRMCLAGALALPIAFHPLRYGRRSGRRRTRDVAKAQMLIAVAGTMMVVVIGDNLARAFALVGLGSFIRFRSVIKSTSDAGVMFLLIGIGMAVGLQHYALAGVATVFVFVILYIFEWFVPDLPRRRSAVPLAKPVQERPEGP